ncbi:urea ABC transporter permease subunit UrtB [Polynucleobacter sp. AP-Latsch-80-C2]|jgi:urea transport system permease protein|uniref:urea ABC transporter permease subunit UrtB n=1 Tax=Polynucleobacter sp. AP-Latsch-80-C2 TaxID=2576931 RepID=UPI001C0DE668|nr:urea ABC transporter permease subunit UrtB [Polynucleobacter sp. AP-Latsch-80-C2]MBU3624334.1 urea ABC transporter permease subunit UrtB [Polynucleobacter sp. AP-Latsch-80-C2]
MKYPHLSKLLLSVLLALSCSLALAKMTVGDLKPIFGESFDAKVKAVQFLSREGSPEALEILQAMSTETLFLSPEGVVIQKNDQYIDALTGQLVTVKPEELQEVVLNNLMRGKVDNALLGLQLASSDVAIRTKAVDALIKDPELDTLPLVEKLMASEKDPVLKPKVEKLWALLALQSDNQEAKLKAIELLGDSGDPQVAALLAPLAKEGGPVQEAAEKALAKIKKSEFSGEILGNVIAGLSYGSVLLLCALGLAITYGLIGVINMAHGEFLMVGAYATYVVQGIFRQYAPAYVDWYLLFALPVAFITAALVGILIERTVIKFLYGRPLETLLATFGVSLLMIQLTRTIFGAQNVEVANPVWMSGAMQVLPNLVVPYNRIIIFAFAIAVVIVTWLVLNKTRLGLFVRAVTQNRTMAACVGVKTVRVDMYAFAFGAGIAGLGGVALSQIGNVGPDLGQSYIVDSFMVVVLGGVGQLAGTIYGAFGLGITSKLLEPFIGAVLAKIAILVFIIIFIQRRPQGLFALKGRSVD